MKNTSRKPYIYKVTNCETHQYYIGSQCSGKTIGVNYFTSSTNKEFREGFKTYGEKKYKIEVIKEFEEFEDPKECVRAENYIIRNYMQKRDGLCLNRFYFCNGKKVFSTVGLHHSEDARKKMSKAGKGRPSPKKGIPRSEEIKHKISESLKGLPAWNKGLHHSDETRKKMSEASPRRIKISIEGTVFNSFGEAAKYYNVGRQAISYWVKTKKGHPSPRRIKISIEGTVFNSITEASKYYNVGKETIRYWAKNKKHNAFLIEK